MVRYSATRTYTPRGLLASETEMDKTTHYSYDSMGRLYKKEKPDGVTLIYTYDFLGRIQTLISSDGTIFSKPTPTISTITSPISMTKFINSSKFDTTILYS